MLERCLEDSDLAGSDTPHVKKKKKREKEKKPALGSLGAAPRNIQEMKLFAHGSSTLLQTGVQD